MALRVQIVLRVHLPNHQLEQLRPRRTRQRHRRVFLHPLTNGEHPFTDIRPVDDRLNRCQGADVFQSCPE